MIRLLFGAVGILSLLVGSSFAADKAAAKAPRDALAPFNTLIGSWKGTGAKSDNKREFWQEKVAWEWQFKGEDAWITLAFTDGKHFTRGTLRFVPDRSAFRLNLETPDKKSLEFEGKLEKNVLAVERIDPASKETQRVVVTMLHETRFLYRFETKPEGRAGFNSQYQVGATREGVPFAAGDTRPECIVSGGLGTMKVTYKGKDYYVCCSGCRDAFKDEPEKYIKE